VNAFQQTTVWVLILAALLSLAWIGWRLWRRDL
jgi:TRAP-type C4-dicarboxylate transport system permease small subunit